MSQTPLLCTEAAAARFKQGASRHAVDHGNGRNICYRPTVSTRLKEAKACVLGEHTEASQVVVGVDILPVALGGVVHLMHDTQIRVLLGDVIPPIPIKVVNHVRNLGGKKDGTHQAFRWRGPWAKVWRHSTLRK